MPKKLPHSIEIGAPLPVPLSRVELHIHLDGSIRPETIWELLKVKGHPLPGKGNLSDLIKAIRISKPVDLGHFLTPFALFSKAYIGDYAAIKRIAYEFCEDEADNGVLYVEARFSPHLMIDEKVPELTPEKVLEAVLEGFAQGEKDFKLIARVILCCIRGRPHDMLDTLRLCEKFRGHGVVGMDIAGDEGEFLHDPVTKDARLSDQEIQVFNEAKNLGIHRTVHAGEAGPAKSVELALDALHAERIGHGYRVLESPEIYSRCLREKVHFETCPHSSILTGSVGIHSILEHPIIRFAEDDANFSINSDDPTITGSYISDEFAILRSWGLSETHLAKSTFHAQAASFLPEQEKKTLKKQLMKAYGIELD